LSSCEFAMAGAVYESQAMRNDRAVVLGAYSLVSILVLKNSPTNSL
jgi:hypothetical protein